MNNIFYSVYVLEILIKVIGLGFKQFFKDYYNIYDFLLILLSTIDIILT
jgi:hypothetical protein